MKKHIVAALLASAIAAPVSAAEMVVNGGFESPNGLQNGWSYSVSNTLTITTQLGAVHSGVQSAQFFASDLIFDDVLYQSFATIPGQSYDYSFWVDAATTDPSAGSAFLAEISGATVTFLSNSGTFGYTLFSGAFVATSSSSDIYFEAYNSLGLYNLDDVSVTGPVAGECLLRVCAVDRGGVPEPSSWALMILGLGGVGAVLRRRSGGSPLRPRGASC